MKLYLPLLVAGAGLAMANPLSVVVSTSEVSAFRLGHPAANAVPSVDANGKPTRVRHMCKAMQKSVQDSVSRIMAAVGFTGDANSQPKEHHPTVVVHHFQPVPVPVMVPTLVASPGRVMVHHHRPMHGHGPDGPFLTRVHRALMSLGPWEGRLVAFVLGCGIGVLLRMFYVLAVVLVRAVRGRSLRGEEDDFDHVEYEGVLFIDAEEIVVPPPQYTDEKVAAAEESAVVDRA
ncbi:hypothetical protein FA95DRAFT_1576341 [Auriscalpium vulgare]|uniref:Uncharacterized protein n=1 Tax=Auriscalpium vulgare TaxID=40419 RepID=A0ACB8RC77_9AGAM|nr:hypothetical protein FA95DRAFT_1576341 [Auriscalpium vulgare]